MSDARWKVHERAVAAELGGRRLPNNGHGQPDVLVDGWALQVKVRKELPAWLTEAVSQARRDCEDGVCPAVVLVHAPGQGRKVRRLVILEWDTFGQVVRNQ